jgi:hypothetical protein
MRQYVPLVTTIFVLASIMGCNKPVTNTPPSPSAKYTLQVTGGAGSAQYAAGDPAYIFSNPPSSTQVFDKWTGDVSNLTSPNEWRSTLKMPSANVSVTATYKTVPAVTFTNVVINGSQVYYYIPATYRGIITPFHGTGGSAANWATGQAENMNFCRYAAANGYAVVITESKDRVNAQWDLSLNNNVDIANIDVVLNTLQTQGTIKTGTPLYGVGMSDGSAFCSLITYLKGYKVSALYCYGGINKVFPLTTVPTIWNMAVMDITDDPNRQITATANYNTLTGRGIASEYYLNTPTPLYASRFAINAGISSSGSTSIYNALNNAGYLDSKGFLKTDPAVDVTWQAVIPAPYNTLAIQAIEDQLYVAYAQHKFYKDSNFRTIDFFNRF